MARAGKGMGHDRVEGHVGPVDVKTRPDEDDLADDLHGKNKLQGNDQRNVRNERKSYPDSE